MIIINNNNNNIILYKKVWISIYSDVCYEREHCLHGQYYGHACMNFGMAKSWFKYINNLWTVSN